MKHKHKNSKILQWIISFETNKILFKTEKEEIFFVKSHKGLMLFQGDIVIARRLTAPLQNWHLPEVQIIKIIKRTQATLVGRMSDKWVVPLPEVATRGVLPLSSKNFDTKWKLQLASKHFFTFKIENEKAKILEILQPKQSDYAVNAVLFVNNIHQNWNPKIIQQERSLIAHKPQYSHVAKDFDKNSLLSQETTLDPRYKISENFPYFRFIDTDGELRVDLRNWFTLTIDGADAKDLDDAISIAKIINGNYLLGVHIADVSYFVTKNSPIDLEARSRTTSIYLPERVIPMLPEALCNNLCSLNPHTFKKTMTILMEINQTGQILQTEVLPSLIESQYRWEYDKIWENFQKQNFENPLLALTVNTAFEAYKILEKRRQNEGKMDFHTTEIFFKNIKKHIPYSIQKREQHDVHKLIEEFMVVANEEVAKWCIKRKIPFLSRFHDAPNEKNIEFIEHFIGKTLKTAGKITAKNIAKFFENLSDDEKFYASRMILPKMSKAIYSANKSGHFGLGLDFYSHFTSPIRRYPDLVTHRMIRSYMEQKKTEINRKKDTEYLTKIAEITSFGEQKAENIERNIDKMYVFRYLEHTKNTIFEGKIAGVSEWAVFVELNIGIEVTVRLPRISDLQLDANIWALIDKNQKICYQIGTKCSIKVIDFSEIENRVFAEFIQK